MSESVPLSKERAFSLVEMLTVVAVMGLLAAVAIAFWGGSQRASMIRVRDQRNAQEVVSLSMGAAAVGASFVEPADMKETIHNLMEGRKASSGAFAGRVFQLSPLTEEEITGAIQYLDWRNGQPIYKANGH